MDLLETVPPLGAVVLFNGNGLAHWTMRAGTPARWKVVGGVLEVVPGMGDMPPRVWQRYNEVFRVARLQGAKITELARMTVLQRTGG